MNRLEHAPTGPDRCRRIGHDAGAIEKLFVELFLDAHKKAPDGDGKATMGRPEKEHWKTERYAR